MAINKILCIDDENFWRKTFLRYFKEYLTPNVDVAGLYESGMEKIRETYYDLIILDGLEGDCFEILEEIRGIPHGDIIICSANSQLEIKAKALGVPFFDKAEKGFIEKIIDKYKG